MSVDKNIRILVVEDNAKIRALTVGILNSCGFNTIIEADNGKIAWELLKKDSFDLVMTDWMKPEMNGLELLKKIRAHEGNLKDIPVLMITASDNQKDIVAAAKWKISGYVVKPFSVKTILSKLSEALN
jgi:two-component system chemotaxis response regulator CheY